MYCIAGKYIYVRDHHNVLGTAYASIYLICNINYNLHSKIAKDRNHQHILLHLLTTFVSYQHNNQCYIIYCTSIRHKEQVYTKVITSHFLYVSSLRTTISLFPGRAAVTHFDRGVDV